MDRALRLSFSIFVSTFTLVARSPRQEVPVINIFPFEQPGIDFRISRFKSAILPLMEILTFSSVSDMIRETSAGYGRGITHFY